MSLGDALQGDFQACERIGAVDLGSIDQGRNAAPGLAIFVVAIFEQGVSRDLCSLAHWLAELSAAMSREAKATDRRIDGSNRVRISVIAVTVSVADLLLRRVMTVKRVLHSCSTKSG